MTVLHGSRSVIGSCSSGATRSPSFSCIMRAATVKLAEQVSVKDNVFWVIALDDAKKDADDKRGARFISRFTKPSRNTQTEIPAYEWHITTDPVTGSIEVTHKLAQGIDVLLRWIEDGVTECSQLAQEMRISPGQVSKLAKKAILAGKVAKEGREYV